MADSIPLAQARRPGRPAGAEPDAGGDTRRAARRLARAKRREGIVRFVLPMLVIAALLFAWEMVVRANRVPPSTLPAPTLVFDTLVQNWNKLAPALWFTAKLTLAALAAAALGGVLLALAFAFSKWMEIGLLPVAVVLQLMPIVAIAPLVLVWVDGTMAALLTGAWIAALLPILSHTFTGLKSAHHHLRDLYALYGATRWQRLRFLLLPSALPHFLAGLKVAVGLVLVGAVAGEFAAGAAGRPAGLAWRIIESMSGAEMPMMFASLLLLSLLGIALYAVVAVLARLLLGQGHQGALRDGREGREA